MNQGDNNFQKVEWSGDQYSPADDDLDELPAPTARSLSPEDRALLELAARALGARFEEVEHEGYGNLHFEDGRVVNAWNSLAFSGDALELAVTLGIQVTPGTYLTQDAVAYVPGSQEVKEHVHFQQDMLIATRRAITRAAAEIGKQHDRA